jgi:hypothetical protein
VKGGIVMDMAVLSENGPYVIYHSADGVILQNRDMEGFAHTHLNNLNTAEWIMGLSLKRKLPRDIPRYLLISLIRVNEDGEYRKKAEELLENRKRKEKYINSGRR